MSFPALIPKSVVVGRIAVKGDAEPILVWRIPTLLLHVAKCPESASDMVEHAVQHHPDSCFMQLLTNLSKILIAAESAVDQAKIAGIIAVAVRFKQRGKIDGIAAKTFDMVDPVDNFSDTVAGRMSLFQKRCGERRRIPIG